MSDRGGRGGRERWASDHERARQRAAERLSLPLPAAENGWLDRHLNGCPSCAAVAADFAAQQAALHALKEPIPPRDLWARTAAALDRVERQAGRDLPNPSVFPGRGGLPGSRGARSIRGLRAERRASAFRSTSRGLPGRPLVDRSARSTGSGFGWVAPFGGLAALAIVIVVGGTALLTNTAGPGLTPVGTPGLTATAAVSAPVATPIQVGAGEVAWVSTADDGTYNLNFGRVDTVCPTTAAPDCAPIASSPARLLPTVNAIPHTVLRSPSHAQLVVVTTSKKGRGGSLIVVAVPTPAPSAGGVSATDTPPAATSSPVVTSPPAVSAPPSATATGGSVAPTDVPASISVPPATPVVPSAGGSSGLPGGTVEPTAPASVPASAGDSSAPGGSETVPPSGGSVGATPGDSGTPASTEPVPPSETASTPASTEPTPSLDASALVPASPQPTATALAIISNVVIVGETAAYSSDGTMLAFTARPADDSHGPDIYLWRVGEAVARPLTSDHASIFSGWLGVRLLGSRAVDASGLPASSEAPSTPVEPSSTDPSASASDGVVPTDSAIPSDGGASIAALSADPFAAPTETSSAVGGSIVNLLASERTNAEGAASVNLAAESPTVVVPRSFILDPLTGLETSLAAPAWRPVVDPTGRFVAYWAGTIRYDPVALSWLSDRGVLALASWPALAGTDPTAILAPVPLLDNGVDGMPTGEWDIRWDETGSHIAIWLSDAGDPNVGRLSLLTVDPATARVDTNGLALHGVPALAGFSIGTDRLAWATPPGQDGEGSRVHVLAWSGENAGKIDSQPASGNDAVIVVR